MEAHSSGALKYTDCISTEGLDLHTPNERPTCDTKPSDGGSSPRALGNMEYPFIAICTSFSLAWSGSI